MIQLDRSSNEIASIDTEQTYHGVDVCPQSGRVAVGCSGTVRVWSSDEHDAFNQSFAFDVEQPVFGFLSNGDLAIACGARIEIYRAHRNYGLLHSFVSDIADPIKILRLRNSQQFALIGRGGKAIALQFDS